VGVNPEKERDKEPFGLYIIEIVCREEDLTTTVIWILWFYKAYSFKSRFSSSFLVTAKNPSSGALLDASNSNKVLVDAESLSVD
jgi:hypothetical protein